MTTMLGVRVVVVAIMSGMRVKIKVLVVGVIVVVGVIRVVGVAVGVLNSCGATACFCRL